MPKVV